MIDSLNRLLWRQLRSLEMRLNQITSRSQGNFHHLLKLTILVQLDQDVGAADKFAIDVDLGEWSASWSIP